MADKPIKKRMGSIRKAEESPEVIPYNPLPEDQREDYTPPPRTEPPPGFIWVYNRLPHVYEGMWDSNSFIFEANEYVLMALDVGNFLHSKSVISYNPTTGSAIRALAIKDSKGWGEPLTREEVEGVELIDRSDDDNPIGWGTGGIKTKATAMKVKGGGKPRSTRGFG